MDEQRIIAANIAAIEALDPELYPELTRLFRKTSIHAHLLHVWTYMQKHPFPWTQDHKGHGYWTIPVNYLKKEHGGSGETWKSHLLFLTDVGLLKRVKPDKRTKQEDLQAAYAEARKKRQRPPVFYRVIEYTPEIFRIAEETAQRYKAHGVNVGHVSKADMIRVSGARRADEIFRDQRKIGAPEIWARDQLKAAMIQRIEAKGYTTWDEIAGDVAKIVPDPEHKKALKKCMDRKTEICTEAGCQHKPPKKEQRTTYQLEDQRWIITKI